LDNVHGLFLSGSPSNVDAGLYGEDITHPQLPQDPLRDGITIPLIRAAVARGLPIMGVCRGFQEINVAFGGTLHQAVHELDDFGDHREDKNFDLEQQYGPAHPVHLTNDGLLHRVIGQDEIMVNSLHGQGLKRLGEGLVADGLVEAFYIKAHPNFGLAVQWHPEWKMNENPASLAVFNAFGRACHDFARKLNKTY
jgi:putative glutamine amidotransferase